MDKKIKKKRISRKQITLIGAAVLLLLIILYSFIFADSRSQASVDSQRIFIHEVEMGDFQEYIDLSATIQPIRTTVLDAIEGGVVQRVYRESGEMVQAGDTILVLANSSLQLSVMQQEAGIYDQINNVRNSRLNLEQNHLRLREELADAQTRLDLLRPRFERDSALYAQGLISLQEFEETRENFRFQQMRYQLNFESFRKDSLQMLNQLRQLDQSEERMWRSLDGVQQIMDNLVVTAPIGGQLSTIELNQGQSISQGEQIGQIDQLDGYKVRAGIDEFYLARVSTGLRGTFDFAGNRHELEISRVFPVVQDGQFEVDMNFTGEIPDGLRRGQTVRVRLELGSPARALLLQRGGFYQQTGGNWVFVVDSDGNRAYRQPVRLGRGNANYYEILEGLQPGDRVITSSYETFGNAEVLVLE